MKLTDFIVEDKGCASENEEAEKCRGCGREDDGSIAFIKGLCKECAEDTYADRD